MNGNSAIRAAATGIERHKTRQNETFAFGQ